MSDSSHSSIPHGDESLEILRRDSVQLSSELRLRWPDLRSPTEPSFPDPVPSVQPPPDWYRLATGFVGTASIVAFAATWWLLRTSDRAIPERRIGIDYRRQSLNGIVSSPLSGEVFVGTESDGAYAVSPDSEYLEHFTRRSTNGGLPSDEIRKLDRGEDGWIYFLATSPDGDARDVSRYHAIERRWEHLLGGVSFQELTALEQVSDVVPLGDRLAVGTREFGVGLYALKRNGWEAVYRKGESGLTSGAVHDLLSATDGTLWAGHAEGLQSLRDGQWRTEPLPGDFLGRTVDQIAEGAGGLWARTDEGGIAARNGGAWKTVAGPKGWGRRSGADVVRVLHDEAARRLWCVASDGAVGRYDLETRSWTEMPALGAAATALALDPFEAGGLFAGTPDGVKRLLPDAKEWALFFALDGEVTGLAASEGRLVSIARGRDEAPASVVSAYDPAAGWRRIVGTGAATLGPKGALAVVYDAKRQRLYVGGERGLSTFDLRTHDWQAGEEALSGEHLVDLAMFEDQVLAVGADHRVHRWDPDVRVAETWLGGGELPQKLADVSAVTVSSDRSLWLAAGSDVFRYDAVRHSGEKVARLDAPVRSMGAAKSGIWIVSDERPWFLGYGKREAVPLGTVRGVVRLFADVVSDRALWIERDGRVQTVESPAAAPQILVGDAAPGLKPGAVTTVAHAGHTLVVGGPSPHVYDGRTRTWKAVPVGEVEQAIAAAGLLWLRTADRRLFSLDPTNPIPVEKKSARKVTTIAGDADRMMAVLDDFSLWQFSVGNNDARVVRTASFGPPSSLLAARPLLVSGDADHIDLSGGVDGLWWRYAWKTGRWFTVRTSAAAELKGITQFARGSDRTYALAAGGAVYSRGEEPGDAARLESVANVVSLGSDGERIAAVDSSGTTWLNQDGAWGPLVRPSPLAGPADQKLLDVAPLENGLVVSTPRATAVLDESLSEWRPVTGGVAATRLYSSGKDVWATLDDDRLARLTRAPDDWTWEPLPLEGVASMTTGAGPDGSTAFATTQAGEIHRIDAKGAAVWRTANGAPGSPADLVGVVETPTGFLCAFRTGQLGHCDRNQLTWESVAGLKWDKLERLVATPGDPGTWWLQASDGKLYRSRAQLPAAWFLAKTNVNDLALSGEDLVAASSPDGTLTRFLSSGRAEGLWRSVPPERLDLADLKASAELEVDEKRTLLVVSDGRLTAAYDPTQRLWTETARGVVEMISANGQVTARRADGTVARIVWKNDRLEFEPRNEWNGAVALAFAGRDATTIAGLWDDGRLTAREGDAAPRTLVGRQLPAGLAKGRPLAVGGHGERFFMVHNDGQSAVYSLAARQWRVLGNHPQFVRMEVHADEAWIEERVDGASRLGVWRESEGNWALHRIPGGLVGWDTCPSGVVATLTDAAGATHSFLYPKGAEVDPAAAETKAPRPIGLKSTPLGPPEATLQGTQSTELGHFLHDDKGRLFQYDASKHAWLDVTPGDAPLREILLHGSAPVLLDRKGRLWLGSRAEGTVPWSFERLAENVTAVDLREERLAYASDDAIEILGLPKKERIARYGTPAAWPATPQKAVAAVGDGPTLFLLGALGDSARYSPSTRAWKRSPPAPWAADRMWVLDAQLHLGDASGRVARLTDEAWETAFASSSTTWKVGQVEWRVDPAGGYSKGKPAASEPAKPILSGEPVRVHAGASTAWLELANGVLCRYDLATHRLTIASRPDKQAAEATGLIRTGERTWFVRESEKLLLRLPDDGSAATSIPLPADFDVRSVVESEDDLLLDSGEAAFVASTGAVLDKEDRKRRLKDARPLAADRLQTSGLWRIVTNSGRNRRLTWSLAGGAADVPIDVERLRLKWDDAQRVMHDGRNTFVATSAGIAVYGVEVAGLPLALLPLTAADEPAEIRFAKFAPQERALAFSRGGRRWSIAPTVDGIWRLTRLSPSASVWTVRETAERLSITLNSGTEDAVSVHVLDRGILDFDVPLSLALSDDWLLATTREFQLSFPADPARSPRAQRRSGTLVTRSPARDLILQRDESGVRKLDRGTWTGSIEGDWSAAVGERGLSGRKFRKSPIRISLAATDGTAPVQMPYLGGRLAIDQPAPSDRTAAGGRGTLLTVAGETVLYGNAWGVGTIEPTPKSGDRIRFFPVKGGVQGFAWLPAVPSQKLLWKSGAGDVLEWRNGKLEPSDLAWPDDEKLILLGKRLWQVNRDGTEPLRLTPTDGSSDRWILDPAQRGFLHDQFRSIGGDPASNTIWGAGETWLERFGIDDASQRETWNAPAPVHRLVPVNGRLLCATTTSLLDLSDPDRPVLKLADASWDSAIRDGLAGRRWRTRPVEGKLVLDYRFPRRAVEGENSAGHDWIPVGLHARWGLAIDRVQRVSGGGEGRVVVETPLGLWSVSAKSPGLDGSFRLPNPFPSGSKTVVARMWTSPAGDLWIQGDDESWRRFDVETGQWTRGDKLPEAERTAQALLLRGAWTWTRTTDAVALKRDGPPGAAPLVVRLTDRKGFDFEPVRAAVEAGDSIWLLCARGLCRLDATERRIVSFDERPALVQSDAGEFLRWNEAWYVSVRKGDARHVFRLTGDEWNEVTGVDDPWTAPRTLWESKSARATARGDRRIVEVKTFEGQWREAAFLPETGQFDFQTARTAVPSDGYVHTLSSGGITTWARKDGKFVFSGFLPQVDELAVRNAPVAVVARGKGIEWQEFFEGRWREAAAPPDFDLTLASTSRWKCTRPKAASPASLQIAAAPDAWHDLPLHAEGDFEFNRPRRIAVDGPRLISVSERAASGWNVDDGTLDWVAPAAAFPLQDAESLTDVFRLDDTFRVVTKERAFALDDKGRATLADPQLASSTARPLLDSPEWEWTPVDKGEPHIARRVGQVKFPLTWNSTTGRFDVDDVSDVYHDAHGLTLATAGGVLSLDADSHQAVAIAPTARGMAGRFLVDRIAKRVLIASAGEPLAVAPLRRDADAAWIVGQPLSADESTALAAVVHADEEWRFTKGDEAALAWRGLASNLSDGRFLHDRFRAALTDGAHVCLETPAGAVAFDRSESGLGWAGSTAWSGEGDFRLLNFTAGALDAAGEGGTVTRWDAAAKAWKPLPNANAARVLVATPQWRWTRDTDGLHVTLGSIVADALDVLPPSGRFVFDDVSCALPTGNSVWLGTGDGLVRRSLSEPSFEWRRGSDENSDSHFGSIERIGRFGANEMPIADVDSGASAAGRSVAVRNRDGETWALDAATGSWSKASRPLWDGPGGLWIARTETLGVLEGTDGIRFVHAMDAKDAPDAIGDFSPLRLENGRFSCDVFRHVAFDGERMFVATDSGMLELSPEGRTLRRWDRSLDDRPLDGCRRVFRHQRDARVCVVCAEEQVFAFEPNDEGWTPASVDEEFRTTATLLHQDPSWTWTVWDGSVSLQVAGVEVAKDGSLFHRGRFAFDAIDDVRCDGDHVWLTTPAGVTVRNPSDGFRIRSLERHAVDRGTGEVVPLDAARFVPGAGMRLRSGDDRFERRNDRWERVRAATESQVLTLDAGDRQVSFGPRASLRGVDVVVRSQGEVLGGGECFTHVPYGDVVGAAWLNGSPWIVTRHALFRSRSKP